MKRKKQKAKTQGHCKACFYYVRLMEAAFASGHGVCLSQELRESLPELPREQSEFVHCWDEFGCVHFRYKSTWKLLLSKGVTNATGTQIG